MIGSKGPRYYLPASHALRDSPECQRIAEIPGVGLLTATATVSTIGDPATFHSGREFAAWLGLVPRRPELVGAYDNWA